MKRPNNKGAFSRRLFIVYCIPSNDGLLQPARKGCEDHVGRGPRRLFDSANLHSKRCAQHSGAIVLTASNYGLVATPHTTAYCTSKGAVAALWVL